MLHTCTRYLAKHPCMSEDISSAKKQRYLVLAACLCKLHYIKMKEYFIQTVRFCFCIFFFDNRHTCSFEKATMYIQQYREPQSLEILQILINNHSYKLLDVCCLNKEIILLQIFCVVLFHCYSSVKISLFRVVKYA